MADPSMVSSILPAVVASTLFSTWLLARQRTAFDKEIRRILKEKWPGAELLAIDRSQLSLRCQGRLYSIPIQELFKKFGSRKINFTELLQTTVLKTTGLTLQALENSTSSTPLDIGNVQFDRADLGTASLSSSLCAECKKSMAGEYFEINGQLCCPECKEQLVEKHQKGSDWKYVPAALLRGGAAAAIGCVIYYTIMAITGYELGLIAIIVGLLVGNAVRKASRERGGPIYQTIAVCLTYAAIVFTYTPYLIKGMVKYHQNTLPGKEIVLKSALPTRAPGYVYFVDPDGDISRKPLHPTDLKTAEKVKKTGLKKDTSYAYMVTPEGDVARILLPHPPNSPVTAKTASAPQSRTTSTVASLADKLHRQPRLVRIFIGVGILLGLILAIPFIAGAKNLMGLIIIGFAVYEAWKLNKRQKLNILGPFRLSDRGAHLPESPFLPPVS